jgi:hypothetical protein
MGDPRLRAMRLAYRGRNDGARDLGYTVYVVGFVALVAVIPVVRILFLALTTPPLLNSLSAPDALAVTAAVSGAALSASAVFGAIRGPAHYAPFLAFVLMESDLPRHRVLRRPFAISTLWVAVALALVGAIPGVALVLANEVGLVHCVPLIAGGAAFGVFIGVVWAWGQRLGRASAWALSAAIGVAVLVTIAVPWLSVATPWGWLGMLYPSPDATRVWPLAALFVLGGVALMTVRPILGGIAAADLVDQSRRWEAASSAAISGDPSLALSTFRPLPSVGRAWSAIALRAPLPPVFWLRDLVGACRTPVRFAFSIVGLIAGGALVTAALSWDAAGWLAGAAGALLSFVSLGGLTDGLRHAAEAHGAPQLYGMTPDSLVRHHSLFPLSSALLAMLAGGGILVFFGGTAIGLLVSVTLAAVVFLVRLFDSAKGPLSPALLTPIPTPFGDLSGTVVLAWEADAALLVTATGAFTVLAFHSGGAVSAAAVVMAAVVAVAVLGVRRFRQL